MSTPLISLSFAVIAFAWIYYLQVRVILLRRGNRIAFGDGENKALRGWIRAHANALENLLPFTLLAFGYELVFSGGWVLIGFMVAMMAARLAHPWGLVTPRTHLSWRVYGMAATGAIQAIFIAWIAVRLILRVL
ncbi:MAG: MAPEG family protein [Alphaproteobacteria bacterium]